MASSLHNYDNWLVKPDQDRIEAYDHYVDWCETHNLGPGDEGADAAYQDWIDSQWEEPDFDEFDEYEKDDFYDV